MRSINRANKKIRLTKWGIISLAVVVAFATIGMAYAAITYKTPINVVSTNYYIDPFTWVVSNDDGSVQTIATPAWGTIDPGDNGNDPNALQTRGVALATGVTYYTQPGRYTENVANTTAALTDLNNGYWYGIDVTLNNAYPYYMPTIFFGLKNSGSVPAKVQSIVIDEDYTGPGDETPNLIDDLSTIVNGITIGQIINPGQEVVGRLGIKVEQAAKQLWIYHIRVRITTCAQEKGGTIGFWRNWNNRYSATKMNNYLNAIDSPNTYYPPSGNPPTGGTNGSKWLVPDKASPFGTINTADLDYMFAHYSDTAKTKLLAQYIATRLNVLDNRLNLYNTHNITLISGWDTLGLADISGGTDPTYKGWGSAQLWQIIAAFENKYGQTPNNKLDIWKNIFDALNNVQI